MQKVFPELLLKHFNDKYSDWDIFSGLGLKLVIYKNPCYWI